MMNLYRICASVMLHVLAWAVILWAPVFVVWSNF